MVFDKATQEAIIKRVQNEMHSSGLSNYPNADPRLIERMAVCLTLNAVADMQARQHAKAMVQPVPVHPVAL